MAGGESGSASGSVSLGSVKGLEDYESWMTEKEQGLAQMLVENGQEHLFADWESGHEDEKRAFFEVIDKVDSSYPSGVSAYVKRARDLLAASKRGDNPFEGMKPEVPDGVQLEFGSVAFEEMESVGLGEFAKSAFVLVAGGLGERLGYGGIKVGLPTETSTGKCYLQLYMEQIMARESACGAAPLGDGVPLAIMTSDDTHARTVALLEENAYFGMAPARVHLLKQEKVPALEDNDAHLSKRGRYELLTKPHGHGDVHSILHASGLPAKWAEEGRTHVVFFQDTNSLCFTVSVAALGVSVRRDFAMNSVTVPRKAKDAVGAIAKLVREDGTSLTINVEYNQLEPMLLASGFEEGDVNEPDTGFSKFPGNINQLVVRLKEYVPALERSGGSVPEFVNAKYTDSSKTAFKKPTRLECMMQELPRLLEPSDAVGFTSFDAWTYSPVKNSIEEARAKVEAGAPGRCAAEGEMELYEAAARQLRLLGCHVAEPELWEVCGFSIPRGPAIVLSPSTAPSFAHLRSRFPSPENVTIAKDSTLIVHGDVVIHSLDLQGALTLYAPPGETLHVRDLLVRNRGWQFQEPDPDAPEAIKIRGFQIHKTETKTIPE